MKFKTTDKELSTIHNLLSVGYCELQYALYWFSPIAYTHSKIDGWKADYYNLGEGVHLVTGYSTPQKAHKINYEFYRKLEADAQLMLNFSYAKKEDIRLFVIAQLKDYIKNNLK